MFLIGHDLCVWSPKGWLTGSALTPGSVLVGTHFERTDGSHRWLPLVFSGRSASFLAELFCLRGKV
jgi:hypothetical protein